MLNEIVVAPNLILRRKSKPIKEITPKVEELAGVMVDFMDSHSEDDNKLIGLSAMQLGHSVRMIAFRNNPISTDREDIVILLNPELVYVKGQHLVKESCLCLPGKVYQLKRFKLVKIRGKILDNTPRSFRGRDLLAQVFQHQLDLLDGVLLDTIGELVK